MTNEKFIVIASGFKELSDIPKGMNLLYHCTNCGGVIPSAPSDNGGCHCGNIFIDKDYWRLIVDDLSKFEVVKMK